VEAIPAWLRDPLVGALAGQMRPRQDVPTEANWRLGIRRLQQVTSIPRAASILRWSSYFSEPMKQALYTDAMREAIGGLSTTALITDDYAAAQASSDLDRTLYADLVNYLTDDGHVKIDRMAMANSLEVRNPFMDVHVVEFAARLPVHAKIDGRTQKRLLREAYADVMPETITQRPKRGFAVPVSTWLNGSLRETAREALLSPDAATRPWFRADAIERLMTEHARGIDDHGKRLWVLLVLELWLRENA
jgi:asparagine synthase (glutamine-hydrolysing)